jgi:hypothetical protein
METPTAPAPDLLSLALPEDEPLPLLPPPPRLRQMTEMETLTTPAPSSQLDAETTPLASDE